MKKCIALILSLILCFIFTACSQSGVDVSTDTYSIDEVSEAKVKLSNAYDTYCNKQLGFALNRDIDYATLSSDGYTLEISTQPSGLSFYVTEDEGLIMGAIEDINDYLGLPSSLMSKIENTRAIDGMMSQTSGVYEITWNYNPDNGLTVIYEINK